MAALFTWIIKSFMYICVYFQSIFGGNDLIWAIGPKMRFGHNCILQDLFRDTPLDNIGISCFNQVASIFHLRGGGIKKMGIPSGQLQNACLVFPLFWLFCYKFCTKILQPFRFGMPYLSDGTSP